MYLLTQLFILYRYLRIKLGCSHSHRNYCTHFDLYFDFCTKLKYNFNYFIVSLHMYIKDDIIMEHEINNTNINTRSQYNINKI